MGLLSRFGSGNTSIGLDLGSNAIKLVQLQETREGISLHKAGSAPTPANAIKGGVVVDPMTVSQSVRSLLDALQIDPGTVVAGVAGPTVVVREVPLPAMSDKQLRRSIQWEARNYISFPVEDSVVEFQVLDRPPLRAAANGQMKVMLVAAPRDMVDSQVETLELAGLEPLAVEIQPFAALRVLLVSNGHPHAEGETTALVGIGAAYSEITIVKDAEFVLSRMIPIAGNAFSEAIKNALEVDLDEANRIKETATQVVLSEEERATLDPSAQQASRAIEPLMDELIREVRRSLAYHDYQQQSPDAGTGELGVNQILLSGGGAKLPRIHEYFQAQLGVPVSVLNVFGPNRLQARGVNPEYLQSHAPTLLVAAGLALRELLLSKQKRNNRSGEGKG
jgi:type IV pilus assembly protein PilM